MRQYFLRIVPMIGVMGTIFLLSHQPGEAMAPSLFPGDDKVVHMAVYGVLAASVIAAFSPDARLRRKRAVVGAALLAALLYGVFDEFHQSFIPGRFPSLADLAADVAGAITACLAWLYIASRTPRPRSLPK